MRIVCDKHIPFFAEAVRLGLPEADLCPLEPEQIDASAVRNANVLVVRTRTRVDGQLLNGSSVRLVCTATIGYDHIDTAYCEQHDIRWMACPGCNAQAVCDYIEEVLQNLPSSFPPRYTLGIVGVGHVGSLVAQMAERKSNIAHILLNDPPKGIGISLDEIAAKCDIITFHTPLTHDGDYPTCHLCDEAFLRRCKPHAFIINAARGGVVDEQALLRSGHPYAIDTWENEPDICRDVLQQAHLASMHIAGYSLQGKLNATQMCLDAITKTFGLPTVRIPQPAMPAGDNRNGWLLRITEQLKAHPDRFEQLRKEYPLR